MKAGEVMDCDVHHDPQWRCMVKGCWDYGVWHTYAWAADALMSHYRICHEVTK